jgi:hypothetical protein
MFGTMIKSFTKSPEPKKYELTERDLELKKIWDDLDQELKDFAKTARRLGLGRNLKTRFNERGIAELVYQLDEIGYEIRKKTS